MSTRARIPQWRDTLRDSDLDRTAKLVGFVLSTYMDSAGTAWPAKTTIARGASLGRAGQKGNTAVDTAVDRLEAAGLLSVDRQRGRRGFHYTAVIPREHEGLADAESLAATGDNTSGIPHGARDNGSGNPSRIADKSLAEVIEIPRRGEGEVEESEKQSVSTARRRARQTPDAYARDFLEYNA